MDVLTMGSHKAMDTLVPPHSTTDIKKSCSVVSLASSQTTLRTICSSSSISVRSGVDSNAPRTPDPPETVSEGSNSHRSNDPDRLSDLPAIPRAVHGGGNTVLGGVAPTMTGTLRRRARFSRWRTGQQYFEVRSTVLIQFSPRGKANPNVSLASVTHKFLKVSQRSRVQQVGDWSWSLDVAGADAISEVPALSKKGIYAFAVEFGAGKKKSVVLAASSAVERRRWMRVLNAARHRVQQEEFKPLSVIGEGHFGKVLLVRWNGRKAASTNSPVDSAASTGSQLILRASTSGQESTFPARVDEESDRSTNVGTVDDLKMAGGNGEQQLERHGNAADGTPSDAQYLAVKEVALYKNTSLPGVLNERQILGVLRKHPFVVTLQCAWRRGNSLYYGLDFLPGADLFELFRRQYIKMDLASARVYGAQVALALEHLHAHGICYRDLKPENILVDANGHLTLADMGLAKVLGVGEESVRTSTVCGTRAYLAPEMVLRLPYDFSVDFWQFGCFLFELYAGHSPFWTPRSGSPGRASDHSVALILAGEISYPHSMEPVSRTVIRGLLRPDIKSRLGCRAPTASSQDIRVKSTAEPTSGAPNSLVDVGGRTSKNVGGLTGWSEVREHEFFAGLDWGALYRKEVPAPLKPGKPGKGLVGNFAREYTRQRAQWRSDQRARNVSHQDELFKRELLGFGFVRHP